jgi:hypothetical protein
MYAALGRPVTCTVVSNHVQPRRNRSLAGKRQHDPDDPEAGLEQKEGSAA